MKEFSAQSSVPVASDDVEIVEISSLPFSDSESSVFSRQSSYSSVNNFLDSCNCITRLSNCISMLPASTPMADLYNPLAKYIFPRPMASYEDPVFVISNHLSYVFKKESTPADLAQCIARGPHGLDGFLHYLKGCHLKWHIPLSCFDFAVDKLVSAILLQFVLIPLRSNMLTIFLKRNIFHRSYVSRYSSI